MPCSSYEPCHPRSRRTHESYHHTNDFTHDIINLAGERGGFIIEKFVDFAASAMSAPLKSTCGVCDFPERECPSKHACNLIREVYPGERVVEPVIARNMGHETKQFIFHTATLDDIDGASSNPLAISPNMVVLAPDKSSIIQISYVVTPQFLPGHYYSADIKVKGYYEQTIRVEAHVNSLDAARCEVVQKECLDRRHHWQDHFYCEPQPKSQPKPDIPVADDVLTSDKKDSPA